MPAEPKESAVTPSVRALTAKDFDAVVALDQRITGHQRRDYFAKRLQAAVRNPKDHLQLAAEGPAGLVGFLLARVAGGEFGRPQPAAVLETVGVDPAAQHRGVGQSLLQGLEDLMRHKNIPELVTDVEWTNHAMLRFLAGGGFALAPRQIVECPVDLADRL